MDLKTFTVSNKWWLDWRGGGHTITTDPVNRGWRAGLMKQGSDVVIIGRAGYPGCISARLLANGKLDVAIYDDATPDAVVKEPRPADEYQQVAFVPGWALEFIQELEQQ